jgi:hypothetical protein
MVGAAPVPSHPGPRPTVRAEAFRSRMLTSRVDACVTITRRTWPTAGVYGLGAGDQHVHLLREREPTVHLVAPERPLHR